MILQAYEYEEKQNRPGGLEEFFTSTEGKFRHPKVIEWVEGLKELRKHHIENLQNHDVS